jgi:DNA-binding beta-propeller fold protein YncE
VPVVKWVRLALLLMVLLAVANANAACASRPPSKPAGAASHAGVPSHTAGPASPAGYGAVSRSAPPCTTAAAAAPALAASATAMTTLQPSASKTGFAPAAPFGVAVATDGSWGFASLRDGLGVFRLAAGRPPVLLHIVALPSTGAAGIALSPDGRLLLVASEGSGAVVVSVPAAEAGGNGAVLGTLSAPGAQLGGAIEVAVSPDSRYAFVSLESADEIAVFNLRAALAHGFGRSAYVGAIPTQVAPVGLAIAPDGRWLYSTSEARSSRSEVGTLAVINTARAESDPATSVVTRVPAGCNPVRVATSPNGSVVWVTARASDALLAFSAAALRFNPRSSLLTDVAVGEAPVGLAIVRDGSLIVVADSNRFNASGQQASLAVIDVRAALVGRPALLGYLPAGTFPRDVAANPSGSAVLVANFGSSQVESLNVADLR